MRSDRPSIARILFPRELLVVLLLATAGLSSGCASGSNPHRLLDGSAWSAAVKNAASDPDTWIPAAGAAVVTIGHADQRISNWARDRTPVFGSESQAANYSNILHGISDGLMVASALGTEQSWGQRALAVLDDELIVAPVAETTNLLKSATSRLRPDGSNRKSFPSGHASAAFAYAALTRENLQRTDWSPEWKTGFTIGSRVFAIGTAWARVEAGRHYPSDVLAGAALGNFMASVLDQVIHDPNVHVQVALSRREQGVILAFRF